MYVNKLCAAFVLKPITLVITGNFLRIIDYKGTFESNLKQYNAERMKVSYNLLNKSSCDFFLFLIL